MKRRLFLKLFSLPALAFARGRASVAPPRVGLIYSDSVGTPSIALAVLKDDNPQTGIEYRP